MPCKREEIAKMRIGEKSSLLNLVLGSECSILGFNHHFGILLVVVVPEPDRVKKLTHSKL